jgi:hypothetical protein
MVAVFAFHYKRNEENENWLLAISSDLDTVVQLQHQFFWLVVRADGLSRPQL